MTTSAFFLVVLILGHSQAIDIKFQSGVAPKKPFESPIDPGFGVTEVKFGSATLPQCSTANATQCYTDKPTSKVDFLVTQANSITHVRFFDEQGSNASFEIVHSIMPFLEDKFLEQNYPLAFLPTSMVPMNNGVAQQSVRVTSDKACTRLNNTSCARVVEKTSHLTVKAAIGSKPVVLTLRSENDSLQATYLPCSAATWMSRSSALILANLVIVSSL